LISVSTPGRPIVDDPSSSLPPLSGVCVCVCARACYVHACVRILPSVSLDRVIVLADRSFSRPRKDDILKSKSRRALWWTTRALSAYRCFDPEEETSENGIARDFDGDFRARARARVSEIGISGRKTADHVGSSNMYRFGDRPDRSAALVK